MIKTFLRQFFIFFALLFTLVLTRHPQAKLEFEKYCAYYNYPVERHQVTTDDGYILTVFRIQKKGTQIRQGLKPVFLQHGLVDSSDTWIINDEAKAPGFILANRGYDVWLGNNRGNKHSRKHVKYNPDKDKAFWEFTFQHMGQYDQPANFKYVYNITKQKIHYIGHSQGTVQMFIALSLQNPVIEAYIDKYFAFGPVAYLKHTSSHIISFLDKSDLLLWYRLRGIHEFMPSFKWFQTNEGILFCSTFPKICGDFMKQICDADPTLDNYERYDVLVGHDPSGTSVMNMVHWKQLFDHGNFMAFDYGSAKLNEQHYGQPKPPLFDLTKIRVPVRLFAGLSDQLADQLDVDFLWKTLSPSVQSFYKLYNSGHLTFVIGMDTSPWMNDLFKILNEK